MTYSRNTARTDAQQAEAVANFLKAATSGELGESVIESGTNHAEDAAWVSYVLGTAGGQPLSLHVDVDAEDSPFGISFTVTRHTIGGLDPARPADLKSTSEHRFVYVELERASSMPSVADYRTVIEEGVKKFASLKYGVIPQRGKGSRKRPTLYPVTK